MALSAKDRLLGMAQSAQNERDKRTQRLQAAIKGGTERQAIRQVGQAAGLVASQAANRVAQMSQTDQYRFNQDQTAANLESVQNNSDFQDVVSRTRGDIYLSGNVFTGDAQARNTVRDIQLLNRDESGEWAKDNFDNAVLYMTPEQQDTMLYYAGTNQWDKASEYLDSIRYRLNQEEMQALTQRTREVSEANPLLGALTNISAGFLTPLSWLDTAGHTVVSGITGEYTPTDPNSQMHIGAQLSQASREGVSAAAERMPILGNLEVGGQNLGSFVANTGLSIGQVASRLLFGGGGALALSAGSAAGEQSYNVLQRGGTQGQAALSGLASGLIEAATEKIGLDNLFSIFGRTGRQGVRQVLSDVARQAGIEATEEAISEVAHNLADIAIMGENSELNQYILQLEQQGMDPTQARNEALKQFFLANTAWAAAGGALSGGLMGGGASAVNATQNRVTLPTAEQGGRLPGGETVQTEQQTPTVQQNNAINLPTADEWLNGQLSRRQPVIEFTGNLNQEQSQALGRMMSSGQVSVDADNNLYQVQEENHIDQRDMGTVRDKRVKAFQFDNPTLHDYFSGAAQDLLNDLADTVPAERWSTEVFNPYSGAVETVWNGTRRVTTDQIATLKDDWNLSYADIQQAAEAIIRNHGQENYAAAKRVELVLDDMLTNGWRDVTGRYHEPNQEYINAKRQIPGAAQQTEHVDNLADIDVVPGEQNNTASTGETESTIVNTDPRVHTPQEQAVISEYQDSTDESLKETFESYLNNPSQSFSRYNISNVSERQATDASRLLGGNYNGYKNAINSNGIIHILNEHGPTGTTDHSLSDLNDAARIGFVLDNYDNVDAVEYESGDPDYSREFRTSDNRPAPMLKFSKKVNGTYYVIEAIPEAKYKKFWVVSAYMQTADGGTQAPNANGPRNTPNASLASSPSAIENSIPQTGQNVNTQANENVEGVRGVPVGPESTVGVDGYGQNTVGSAQARFPYREADTQSVANNLFTEEERANNPILAGTTHKVYTNEESRYDAMERLTYDFDGEKKALQSSDEWGAAENVMGMEILRRLTEEARRTGDYSETVEWKKVFDQKGTIAGQALQSRRQYAGDPAYIEAEAAEVLSKKLRRGITDEQKQEILQNVRNSAETLSNIQPGDTDSIISLIESVSSIRGTNGLFSKNTANSLDSALRHIAENSTDGEQFLRDLATAQIKSIAPDYQKTPTLERLRSLRISNMLSKVSTIARNLVSNNIFDPLESLSNNIGILADVIMEKFTGRRTTAFDRSWFSREKRAGSLDGLLKSYVQVALDASVDRASDRYETGSSRTFHMTGNFLERLLSTWQKYQGYFLNTTDEFQKGGIRAEQQRGIDELRASGRLGENELEGWAEDTARQRTFQNEGALSRAATGLRNAANYIGIRSDRFGNFGAGDILLPFARVPANLVAQSANYSPAGSMNSLRQIVQVAIAGKNATAEQQAQAARNFGRGVSGSALLAGFGALAAKGLISVAGSYDEDQEALERAQGRTGTQWNLSATLRAIQGDSTEWQDGDTLMSIGFLDPINSIMAAGAILADELKEDGNLSAADIGGASLSSLWQAVLDMPAMSSVSDLIDSYTYAEGETDAEKVLNAAASYAASQASSFLVPNFLRGIATGIDDTVRNQYAGETAAEDAWNSILASTPVARGLLPASLDNFGRERTYTGNELLNFLNSNILPGQITRYTETGIEAELERLYEETGASGIFPDRNVSPGYVSYNGTRYDLTPEEKDIYQRTRGQMAEQLMGSIMETETYQNATPQEKADLLSDINTFANDLAKRELLESRDVEYESSTWGKVYDALDALESRGVSTGEAIGTIMEVRNATGDGYLSSNNKRTALANSDLGDNEKAIVYHYLISDSRDDDIEAFFDAGISFDQFLRAQNEYAEINDEYDTASEKSVAFSRWVNSLGLPNDQASVIKSSFQYFSQIPQDNSYYDKMISAGLDDETAFSVNEAIRALEPLDGEDSVSSLQRYRAVIDTVPDFEEQLLALESIMDESTYRKVSVGYQDFGVSPNAYITVREILPQFDEPNDNGNYGTYTQAEYQAALDSLSTSSLILPGDTRVNLTNDQKAVLWQLLTGSSSAKNNPYSVRIGNQVLSALEAAKNEESEDFAWMLNLPRA